MWRDYVTAGLFAAAVASCALRPLRMPASLLLVVAGFGCGSASSRDGAGPADGAGAT